MKREHEETVRSMHYSPSDQLVRSIATDLDSYWLRVHRASVEEHEYPELAVPIDAWLPPGGLIQQLRSDFDGLLANVELVTETDRLFKEVVQIGIELGIPEGIAEEKVLLERHRIEPPFEAWALGIPNFSIRMRLLIDQLELHLLAAQLLKKPFDRDLLDRFRGLQEEFVQSARTVSLSD